MLLPAGKYTLAKDQHMIELAENLEFYAKDGEKEKLFVGLRIEEDYLGFLLANKDGVDRFPNSEQWQEDEEYRTITTTKDQHISERLYYWLVGNRLYVPNRLKLKSRLELPEVPETPEQQKNESLEGGHYSFKSELSTTYTWSSLKGFSEEAINNQIYIEPIAVEGKGTINAITVPCRIYRTVEKLDEETGEYIDFVETDATIVGCYFQEDPEAIQIAYLSGLDNAYAPTEPTESPWLLPVQNITVLNQLVHSNTKERFLAAVSSVEKNRQEGGLVLTWDGMYNNQHNEEFAGFYYTKISDAIYTIEELQEATVHIINTAANPDELNGTYSNIVIVEDSDGYDTLCYETEDGIHFLGVSILRDPSLLFPDVPAGIYFGKNIETGVYPSKLELPNAPQLDIETIEPEVIEVEPVLLFEEYFDFLIEVPSFNLSLPSKGIKVDSSGLYVYDTANEVEQWNDITGAGTEGEVFLVFGEGKVPSAKLQNWLARNCEVFLSPGEYRLKLAPALPSNDIKQDLTLNFNGLLDGLIPMTDLRPGITINQSGIFLGAPETTEGDESVSTTDTDTIDALEFLLIIFALLLENAEAFPVYINIPLGEQPLSTWFINGLRDMTIEEAQYVSWAFSDWFLTNQERVVTGETIHFKLDDTICSATDGIDWNFWLKKQHTDLAVERSQEEYLFKDGFLVSKNGQDVKTEQSIIKNAAYEITPQIRLAIKLPKGVYHNLFFAKRLGTNYILRPNMTYKIPFVCTDGSHLEPKVEFLTDYLSYSIQNNMVTVITGDFPTNFRELPVFNLPINALKTYYCKMIEEKIEHDGTALIKMEPQYAVRVKGDYYISQGGPRTTSYTAENYQDKKIFGVAMSFPLLLCELILGTIFSALDSFGEMMDSTSTLSQLRLKDDGQTWEVGEALGSLGSLEELAPFFRSVFGDGFLCMTDTLHIILSSFRSDNVLPNKVYLFGNYMEEIYNQTMPVEDLIGQTVFVVDRDPEKRLEAVVSLVSLVESVDKETIMQDIQDTAEKEGCTPAELIELACIEQFQRKDIFSTFYARTIDEEMLVEIKDWLNNNPKIYHQVPNFYNLTKEIPLNSFSKMLENSPEIASLFETSVLYNSKEKADIIYSVYEQGSPEQEEVFYGLLNLGKKVLDKVVFSDDGQFNLTVPSSLSTYECETLAIENYRAPVDRYSPGEVTLKTTVWPECFSGDTLITLKDGSKKRVDSLVMGEEVMTPNGAEKIIFTDATKEKIKNAYTIYYFEDGTKLTIVKNHRVFNLTKKKYVHISTLKIGDTILKEDQTVTRLVKKVAVTGEDIRHYTLFTENENAYYANGVLCGNRFSNIKCPFIRKGLLELFKKLTKESK